MKRFLILICLSLCTPSQADAFIQAQAITTPGGLKAWFVYDATSPIVSLSFSFVGGSAADEQGKNGTAEMLSGMLVQGAGPMDKKALTAKVQDLAIKMNFKTDLDFFSGTLQTIQANKHEAFRLLGLILTQPRLTKDGLEHVRRLQLTYLSNVNKDPQSVAERAMDQSLFPDHAYGHPSYGNVASIQSIQLQDFSRYIGKYFVKSGLVLGITGKLTKQEATKLLDSAFGHLPQGKPSQTEKTIKPQSWNSPIHIKQDIPQSYISFAHKGWSYGHKNFIAADILIYILGGAPTSRLMEEIREKRGYAYFISSWMSPHTQSGLVAGNLGTSHHQSSEAIALLKTEWKRMRDHGVTQKELQDAKTYLINSFPLRFKNSLAIAHSLKRYQIYQFDISYFQKRQEIIEKISLAEMNTLAKTLLKPEQLSFVVVGRANEEEHPLPKS